MIYDLQSVKARYGEAPKEQLVLDYVKALKLIIGADGVIAAEEWGKLKSGMLRLNIPNEVIQEIEDFDISSTSLEALLPDIKKNKKQARYLILDAIELARADGTYAQEEKEAVRLAAQLVDVQADVVSLLESLVVMQHGISHMRNTLLPGHQSS